MTATTRARNLLLGAIGAGVACAVSLLLPWFDLGGDARSSIDLISSLGALDVIEGVVKGAVVAAWLATPVLVAAAMLSGAAQRPRLAAGFLIPVGVALPIIVAVVLAVDAGIVEWGAYATVAFALTTLALAIMVLVSESAGEEARE